MKKIASALAYLLKNKTISGAGEGEKVVLTYQKSPLVFLCADFSQAGKLKKGFEALGLNGEIISASRENKDSGDKNLLPYIQALGRFFAGKCDFLIFLPCSALLKFDASVFGRPLTFKTGENVSLAQVTQNLSGLGYTRVDLVSEAGQFALRGDILDVYDVCSADPIRIEFFDDLVESIHYFDPLKMKNTQALSTVSICPAILPLGEDNIFSLNAFKVLDGVKAVQDEFELLLSSYRAMSTFDDRQFADFADLYSKADLVFDIAGLDGYSIQSTPPRNYLTDFMALRYDIEAFLKMQQTVVLFAGSEHNKGLLCDFLRGNNLAYHDFDSEDILPARVYVSELNFPYSFSFLRDGIVAVGSEELFRQQSKLLSRGGKNVFYLPKLGDYVVHNFHGIGRCIKIERMQIADYEKDYFVIEYKNGGILYLPSEEANSISAYVGSEEEPKLSSLGGGEFTRLKERVKASLKDMAFSLLEMYREREKAVGFKFRRDEFLEKQFDDAFGYELTADQQKAIADINADMESRKVMDRLICGDVGYGKTEVALRAAFKCAYNSKQAALLCPTTILSQQHYLSATARLSPFGVKVEVLNRFKTPAQVKDILARLKAGQIDLLIGTHRLLNKDVVFKDLGLLILDEEQRFGVEHKEKIKNAKRNLDVLSLSATPIPRTLNMSLSGIRDISVIETPPKDRLPIQTYVVDQSEQLIKDVLSREISRGGRAFVIYNRVESIDKFASTIRALMPKARVGVAHGQMPERELEGIVSRLFDGEYDIFISTTLIENGIDLPSANTMIIIDADRLGLSQLYQLRGRIGRSDKLSYAYLTYDGRKVLTQDAYKRLAAIKEFSSLGSGFKIAMRDLEIRGAGNIFGKEQHGHIAKVGYDMFVKLLDEAVTELKGQKTAQSKEIKMEIALDAFIGEYYIEDSDQRINLYTNISALDSIAALDELENSLKDAYGALPVEVDNLCKIALLKNLAQGFDVNRIVINGSHCNVFLVKTEQVVNPKLAKALSSFSGVLAFENTPKLVFDKACSIKDKLENLIDFFDFARKS